MAWKNGIPSRHSATSGEPVGNANATVVAGATVVCGATDVAGTSVVSGTSVVCGAVTPVVIGSVVGVGSSAGLWSSPEPSAMTSAPTRTMTAAAAAATPIQSRRGGVVELSVDRVMVLLSRLRVSR